MAQETIQELFDRLREVVREHTEVREEATTGKPRRVSKKAKNVEHGDVVYLPNFERWVEVNCWTRMGDRVCLGEGATTVSLDAEARVSVRRWA